MHINLGNRLLPE